MRLGFTLQDDKLIMELSVISKIEKKIENTFMSVRGTNSIIERDIFLETDFCKNKNNKPHLSCFLKRHEQNPYAATQHSIQLFATLFLCSPIFCNIIGYLVLLYIQVVVLFSCNIN